jgi:hypothetical protein
MALPMSSTFRGYNVLACKDHHSWPTAAHVLDIHSSTPRSFVRIHYSNNHHHRARFHSSCSYRLIGAANTALPPHRSSLSALCSATQPRQYSTIVYNNSFKSLFHIIAHSFWIPLDYTPFSRSIAPLPSTCSAALPLLSS